MKKQDKTETLEGLAHKLWVKRGKPIGSPEVDWARAEALLAEISQSIKLVNAAVEKVQQSGDAANGPSDEIDRDAHSAPAPSLTIKEKIAAPKRATGQKPAKRVNAKKTAVTKTGTARVKSKATKKISSKRPSVGATQART